MFNRLRKLPSALQTDPTGTPLTNTPYDYPSRAHTKTYVLPFSLIEMAGLKAQRKKRTHCTIVVKNYLHYHRAAKRMKNLKNERPRSPEGRDFSPHFPSPDRRPGWGRVLVRRFRPADV